MDAEPLCRAICHDLQNLLGGVEGLLALDEVEGPSLQHRLRLAQALEEGRQLLGLARGLGLGPGPQSAMSWSAWRAGLEARLEPVAALHHCALDLLDGGAQAAPWPGPAFLDWVAACSRSLLPWASPGVLRLEARLDPGAWTVHWPGEWPLPQALHPEDPSGHRLSPPGLWLRDMTGPLGVTVTHGPEGLKAHLLRP